MFASSVDLAQPLGLGRRGVGTLQDLADGITEGHADAVLAASIFHYQHHTVQEAKQFMAALGIPMRLT